MTKLNEEQAKMTVFNIDSIKQLLELEINRLVASGGVQCDNNGDFPLSTIYKVALENIANSYGTADKKQYKNLQKF